MAYIPNSPAQRQKMLDAIGVESCEDLLAEIPGSNRCGPLLLESGKDERDVYRTLRAAGGQNTADGYVSFLGGGMYDHYVPAVVDAIASRPEFVTAYTPYQAEASQGYLQAMFDYQTAISRLTGMDCSNASHYDGATALAEAVKMAWDSTKRPDVLVSSAINPEYRAVLKTYSQYTPVTITDVPLKKGFSDFSKYEPENVAAVVVQYPNFFGLVEDIAETAAFFRAKGTLVIVIAYPVSLGLLEPPGTLGADIVVGDGQSLGNYLSYGGPHFGFMTARKRFMRKLPGRIVGLSEDKEGSPAYCLTLQAREQHIRREKASSNICSNQALCALRALVYLLYYGSRGLSDLAQGIHSKADALKGRLMEIQGVTFPFSGSFFNEFVYTVPDVSEYCMFCYLRGVIPGLPLNAQAYGIEGVLTAVTEKNSPGAVDLLVETTREYMEA